MGSTSFSKVYSLYIRFRLAIFTSHNSGEGDPEQYAGPEGSYRLQRRHPTDLDGEGFSYARRRGLQLCLDAMHLDAPKIL